MPSIFEWRHKKTGKIYIYEADVINATNSNDGQKMILYKNQQGQLFVRDTKEFGEKFERVL